MRQGGRAVKSYSPYESIPELLDIRANRKPDAVAMDVCGQPRTYAELWERAGRVQAWLEGAGVQRGQNVAVMMRNRIEFVEVFLGLARMGAVAVPVNTAMIGEPLRYTLEHSESLGIVADADLFEVIETVGPVASIRWSVAVAGDVSGSVPFAELVESVVAPASPHKVDGLDPMGIIYTSGTTGPPKGVVLSHTSYANTGAYMSRHLGLNEDDVVHTCLPLFHCNAQQTSLMMSLHMGIPLHIDRKFSTTNFWSWIARTGATVTNVLGTMLVLLSKLPETATERQESLRYILGAPVPESLHRTLEARWGLRIVEGYGLTETGTMACINPISDTRSGTIGVPLEHNELEVVDEKGERVPDGTVGEIRTRTRIVGAYMTGYFKEPVKTAEVMAGGWFHTGDLGFRRPDGYFVFLDRMKDAIRRRGENVSSYFVEKAIAEHPEVLEVAAVGVPSELSEEDVKVYVVRRPGSGLTEAALSRWCEGVLSDFMRPRYFEFRGELPRTETGRIHKYVLRREGVGAAWDSDLAPAQGVAND